MFAFIPVKILSTFIRRLQQFWRVYTQASTAAFLFSFRKFLPCDIFREG